MSDDNDDQGKIFHFKTLVPRIRAWRKRTSRTPQKIGPFFSRGPSNDETGDEIGTEPIPLRPKPVAEPVPDDSPQKNEDGVIDFLDARVSTSYRLALLPLIVWFMYQGRHDLVIMTYLASLLPDLFGPDLEKTTPPAEDTAPESALSNVTRLSTRSSFVRRTVLRLPPWMTANRVTLFRTLLLGPMFVYLSLELYGTALALYLFSKFLDFVDGAIAKNREQHRTPEEKTRGAFYDATADKAVNYGDIGWLYATGHLPILAGGAALYCVVFIGVVATFVRLWKMTTQPKPRVEAVDAGKIKLVLEIVSIALMHIALMRLHQPTMDFAILALILSVPFAAWSLLEQSRK